METLKSGVNHGNNRNERGERGAVDNARDSE